MTTAITGACGEHYIASYLSGFGLLVALPRGGVPGSDPFVAEVKCGSPVRVQVKTGKQSKSSDKNGEYYVWDTSYSVIERPDRSLWFAYVWLNGWPDEKVGETNLPEVVFVPAHVVIAHMKKEQAANKKRPFFWMYSKDAAQYRGIDGLKLLREAMKPNV